MKKKRNNIDFIEIAKSVLNIEIESIKTLAEMLDDRFSNDIEII